MTTITQDVEGPQLHLGFISNWEIKRGLGFVNLWCPRSSTGVRYKVSFKSLFSQDTIKLSDDLTGHQVQFSVAQQNIGRNANGQPFLCLATLTGLRQEVSWRNMPDGNKMKFLIVVDKAGKELARKRWRGSSRAPKCLAV